MTTSNEQISAELLEATTIEPRTAEYLIDHFIPYSEMTDAEIEGVVEYKAAIKVRDQEYQDRLDQMKAESDKRIEMLNQQAQESVNRLDSLLDKLLNN